MNSNYTINPMGVQMGTQYVNKPMPASENPVSPEIAKHLQNQNNKVDWTVTQDDLYRSICTHRLNGQMTLVPEDNGYWRCTICGKRFRMFEGDAEQVQRVVDEMINIIQTTKVLYQDLPKNFAASYYQFIPLLEKLPVLWSRSVNNWNQYNSTPAYQPTNLMYQTNGFNMLGQLTGNPVYNNVGYAPQPGMVYAQQGVAQPMAGQPMAQQPGVVYPQQTVAQPMMASQPMAQQPGVVYPQQTVAQPMMAGQQVVVQPNPMAYGTVGTPAPMPGTIPAPQGMVNTPAPQQTQAPAANAESQNNGEVVQSQTFNV